MTVQGQPIARVESCIDISLRYLSNATLASVALDISIALCIEVRT